MESLAHDPENFSACLSCCSLPQNTLNPLPAVWALDYYNAVLKTAGQRPLVTERAGMAFHSTIHNVIQYALQDQLCRFSVRHTAVSRLAFKRVNFYSFGFESSGKRPSPVKATDHSHSTETIGAS